MITSTARARLSFVATPLLAFVLLLSACGPRTPLLPRLSSDAVVLAFGDSLTFGTGAEPRDSYPAQLEKLIGRKVIASGIPGEISAEGLARFPATLDQLRPQLVILCHGGNDFLRKLGDEQAAGNLRSMVRLALAQGAKVVLIGVPKPGLLLSTAGFYEEVAKEFKLPYEDSALKKILADNELKSDIAHPNARGYARLAESVAALLKKSGAI